jgi:hypothetical protein
MPLITISVHRSSPDASLKATTHVLKAQGTERENPINSAIETGYI